MHCVMLPYKKDYKNDKHNIDEDFLHARPHP